MFTSVSNRSAAAYKRVSIETSVDSANPHRLISLLFEALQRSLNGALNAIQNADMGSKIKHIDSAIRLLDEGLKAPLNLNEGGQIAANLNDLYDYCINRLVFANIRNDATVVQEVIRVINPIASGWNEIKQQGLLN
jgi:flagellar secretion chaperone FliS